VLSVGRRSDGFRVHGGEGNSPGEGKEREGIRSGATEMLGRVGDETDQRLDRGEENQDTTDRALAGEEADLPTFGRSRRYGLYGPKRQRQRVAGGQVGL